MEEDTSQIFEYAHSEFKKQNFKRADELYTKFISSCVQSRDCEVSNLATAYNNRGQIKYFRVDFHEAIEDYTSAIQTDSQWETPFYNRGLIHYRLASAAAGTFNHMSFNIDQVFSTMPRGISSKH
ncbi:tetratricopeptide repeat protein 32 isoform X2 [Micropterus dolomieu]|uniref:tetratricopeptide repeat protein 32 isoform X2 n=1 Tax=Micropterus dolomieu TaxID=147949 RepID=UPI001E8DE4CF|nr:tetratricopeptide repeat protein 32 isoform X2 [Micropterus dolomieu]